MWPNRSSELSERMPTIDIHAHVMVPECVRIAEEQFSPRMDPFLFYTSEESRAQNRRHLEEIAPKFTQPEQRLRDMDRAGIDLQAVSVVPTQYYYWTDPGLGARLARMENDRLAEIVSAHPDRFVGLGTVPLQDVGRAIEELDRVVGELGFRGIELGSNVNGLDLDHSRFRPFFAKAQELGVLILIHPNGSTQGERLTDYYLINVVGMPLDSTVAVSRLIFGGVLEEYPNLEICIVHGGGYLPSYPDRMDHAYQVRPECRRHIPRPPSTYLAQLFFDTVVFSSETLGRLVERWGSEHLLLGTDYPFDMGEEDPLALVAGVASLSDHDRRLILGGNAARLLKLSDPVHPSVGH